MLDTMDVEDMDTSGDQKQGQERLICKVILTPGVWGERPGEGAKCKVSITNVSVEGLSLEQAQEPSAVTAYLSGSFDGNMTMGEGDTVIDRALERCIQTMLIDEQSSFTVRVPSEASTVSFEEPVAYVGVVRCTVALEQLCNEDMYFEWSEEKKYERALHHKVHGVELFKSGRTVDAFLRFSKAFKFVIAIDPGGAEAEQVRGLHVTLLNNMASCQLQFHNFSHVVNLCTKVLDEESDNVKSLYRRATAYVELQDYDGAKQDLLTVLRLEPSNVLAKEKLNELKERRKAIDARYAALLKKMFA